MADFSSAAGFAGAMLRAVGDQEYDPVEAYFECLTLCSLEDGECQRACTLILRQGE
ncbi:MAG: hypothetical protein ACOVNL_07620 [Prochlorococcaceae cyanobacterium]|jgi:hypothetical protein